MEMFSLAKVLDATMAAVTSSPARPERTAPAATTAVHEGTTPEELADELRLNVTRLARQMRRQSDTDMTPTQLAALATIERAGPMPIGALAEAEQIGAPTATKIVDKLEAAGQVERTADPTDRRVTLVGITAAGLELLRDLRARKTAWLATRLSALAPDELAALAAASRILERLAAPTRTHPTPTRTTATRRTGTHTTGTRRTGTHTPPTDTPPTDTDPTDAIPTHPDPTDADPTDPEPAR